MKHILRFLALITLVVVLGPVVLYVGLRVALGVMGYKFADSPEALAQQLVFYNRPAEECMRYVTLDIMFRPPTRELRMRCVREYAKVAKDPSACELLMPSEYGIQCIANVTAVADDVYNRKEWCNPEEKELYCYYDYGRKKEIVSYESCDKEKDILKRDWCFVGRSWHLKDASACNKISDITARDACRSELALRSTDIKLCLEVSDPVHRSACEVLVRTFSKYPELRP